MNDIDYIPVSYLSHYYYCRRRAALLMLEQIWVENEYTAEGRMEHERVHTGRIEKRSNVIKVYDYVVTSDKLKLLGKCDCVEAVRDDNGHPFPFAEGKYKIYPVEYKHGKIRNEEEYNIQLCAQAICLEEMLNCNIDKGAVFYIDAHRRIEVDFTDVLRRKVISGAEELNRMYEDGYIPYEAYSPKCRKCSLLNTAYLKLKNQRLHI